MKQIEIFNKWNKIEINNNGKVLIGIYNPPKCKYPRREIILNGVDKSYMDMNDIKKQLIYEIRRQVRKKMIFGDDFTGDVKNYIDRLKIIAQKYPYVDINIPLEYKEKDEDGNIVSIMEILAGKVGEIVHDKSIQTVVRILDTEEEKIKKTDKISFMVDNISPYYFRDINIYIGLKKTEILVEDDMKKKIDDFFKKVKKCNYCHLLGHSTHTCRNKRDKIKCNNKILKQKVDNKEMGVFQMEREQRTWYPPPICRECGQEGHRSSLMNQCKNDKKCLWCEGSHATRLSLNCPLMKKLLLLYNNAMKMKMAGEDISKWKNIDILRYDEWKKVRDEQIRIIQQQQNDNDKEKDDQENEENKEEEEQLNKLQNEISQKNNENMADKIDSINNTIGMENIELDDEDDDENDDDMDDI